MELTAAAVHETVKKCLFTDEEFIGGKPPERAVIIDAIVHQFGFDPDRVAEQKSTIAELLANLEDSFFTGRGGGMSFLQACMTRTGEHWGEHRDMAALFALGQAAGFVKCREMAAMGRPPAVDMGPLTRYCPLEATRDCLRLISWPDADELIFGTSIGFWQGFDGSGPDLWDDEPLYAMGARFRERVLAGDYQ